MRWHHYAVVALTVVVGLAAIVFLVADYGGPVTGTSAQAATAPIAAQRPLSPVDRLQPAQGK
jgi:hypothetical protein